MHLNRGFTLIEILITTVIVFLLFTLIYMTFFSVANITSELQKNMRSSEIVLNFLNRFYAEGKSFIEDTEPGALFQQKQLAFTCSDRGMSYPYYLQYAVEADERGETLVRQQKNLLDGHTFTFPVLENYESIDFLFYNGEKWDYAVDDSTTPTALAIEIYNNGERIFYPVKLPVNGQNAEKE